MRYQHESFRKTICPIEDRVIGYSNETQGEYVMRFLDRMFKLHALAKLIKDLSTWHGHVA